jgi:hypothetical protein
MLTLLAILNFAESMSPYLLDKAVYPIVFSEQNGIDAKRMVRSD